MYFMPGSGTTTTSPEQDSATQTAADRHAADGHDERMSTASVLDSEESMEDDLDLDLDMTMDDKSDQMPLFIIFTCTIKSRLQQYSIPLKNMTVCLGNYIYL